MRFGFPLGASSNAIGRACRSSYAIVVGRLAFVSRILARDEGLDAPSRLRLIGETEGLSEASVRVCVVSGGGGPSV